MSFSHYYKSELAFITEPALGAVCVATWPNDAGNPSQCMFQTRVGSLYCPVHEALELI